MLQRHQFKDEIVKIVTLESFLINNFVGFADVFKHR